MDIKACAIVNGGGGAWAFEPLARRLSAALWVDNSPIPRAYNYLLHIEDRPAAACGDLFIPFQGMQLASDKRMLAEAFAAHAVPTPETVLVDSLDDARKFRDSRPDKEWCLKYPTGCGAAGHRLLADVAALPASWPHPLVVQEFVRLEKPEVYRLYGAGGDVFGWVARRFPGGARPSPWVAHARGARYERAGDPPAGAVSAARAALTATGLLDSFGCVDLLCRPSGEWVVLEVGTDGVYNHVDRDIGLPELEREVLRRIAEAFWSRWGWRPWGDGEWHPRETNQVPRDARG